MNAPAPLRFAVLAADTALFTVHNRTLYVRLVRVARPPHFPDNPGLPGGLIAPYETAEEAARRHAAAKTSVVASKAYFEQLYTFSEVARDPRGRVVAVAYLALVSWEMLSDDERQDSEDTYWAPVSHARKLAYDHDEILKTALMRLKSRLRYTTLIQKLMPSEFTLTELEQTYESVLGKDLDKRNFRKKILKLKVLKELPRKRSGGRSRPAQLYRFASNTIREIEVL
ncbi:MAG: NUDIX domain-containing protein [bacterium]|nr:NUDIX domain-containing protein [bacterium]